MTFHLTGKKEEANFIILKLYFHVKEWHKKWVLVKTRWGSPWLQEPAALAVKHSGWASHATGDSFEPVLQCIKLFAEKGLDGHMVVLSFARMCLAPLQAR